VQPTRPGLLAFDLDGTVFDPLGRVSDRTAAALRAAAAAGWTLVVATGRPSHLIGDVATPLGSALAYGVTVNGGTVLDLVAGTVLRQVTMARSDADAIVRRLRLADEQFGFAMITDETFGYERGFLDHLPAHQTKEDMVADVLDIAGASTVKIVVFHPDHGAASLLRLLPTLLGPEVDISHLGAEAVEIGPVDINKATGVTWLSTHLGFTAADVIAIGDNQNDNDMLAWAGHGVAMANGDPTTIAIANEVIGSNAEDGVGIYIERLLNSPR
jgi:Cof subfamily protein (haloacid dehalogenase superfamily)